MCDTATAFLLWPTIFVALLDSKRLFCSQTCGTIRQNWIYCYVLTHYSIWGPISIGRCLLVQSYTTHGLLNFTNDTEMFLALYI